MCTWDHSIIFYITKEKKKYKLNIKELLLGSATIHCTPYDKMENENDEDGWMVNCATVWDWNLLTQPNQQKSSSSVAWKKDEILR